MVVKIDLCAFREKSKSLSIYLIKVFHQGIYLIL